jgi:hypothetical protein
VKEAFHKIVSISQLAVDAFYSDHKGVPVEDPPRIISDAEAKSLKPVASDKKSKNVAQRMELWLQFEQS